MSIASPTLRSSSSTVPGPSLSRSPTSILARPSTAETCTGTSNTASRAAARRLTSPPSASAFGSTGGMASALPSRSGSSTLLLSLMARFLLPSFLGHGGGVPRAEIAADGVVDSEAGLASVAHNAAVGPFNLAVANGVARLGQHDKASFETLALGDFVELGAGGLVQRVVDAHHDVG